MNRLRVLTSAIRSLFWPRADRPTSSEVLTAMLRQAGLPHWSGQDEDTQGRHEMKEKTFDKT